MFWISIFLFIFSDIFAYISTTHVEGVLNGWPVIMAWVFVIVGAIALALSVLEQTDF